MKKRKWTDEQFETALRNYRIRVAKIQLKASRQILMIAEKMEREFKERA